MDGNARAGGRQDLRLDAGGAIGVGEVGQILVRGERVIVVNTDGDADFEMAIRLAGVSAMLGAGDFIL